MSPTNSVLFLNWKELLAVYGERSAEQNDWTALFPKVHLLRGVTGTPPSEMALLLPKLTTTSCFALPHLLRIPGNLHQYAGARPVKVLWTVGGR